MDVAFVGLGNTGGPMARNRVRSGLAVTGQERGKLDFSSVFQETPDVAALIRALDDDR